MSEVSEATFCRVLLYVGHPDISTDRDKYSGTIAAIQKKQRLRALRRQSKKRILLKMHDAESTVEFF